MLDWNKELKTEPPLISRFSDEVVTRILDNFLDVPDWCNHTQAVERAIKAVTESCTALTGARHGGTAVSGNGDVHGKSCQNLTRRRSITAAYIIWHEPIICTINDL